MLTTRFLKTLIVNQPDRYDLSSYRVNKEIFNKIHLILPCHAPVSVRCFQVRWHSLISSIFVARRKCLFFCFSLLSQRHIELDVQCRVLYNIFRIMALEFYCVFQQLQSPQKTGIFCIRDWFTEVHYMITKGKDTFDIPYVIPEKKNNHFDIAANQPFMLSMI